jgi:integrase
MLVMRAVANPENTVDDRPKNFLTEAEVENFLKAGRKGRHNVRNFAMLLLAFRHGLRVSELITCGWLMSISTPAGCSSAASKAASRPANL